MTEESITGPDRISFTTFLLKILAGLGGGIVGTLILLLIFILSQSILDPFLSNTATESISPIFVFILMIMIFLSSTVGNLLSSFLLSLTEGEKYKRRASAIYQTFILSIIIFILMVPVYFITATLNVSLTAYAIALHIIISAQLTAIILEVISNYRHALVGIYGVTFSILLSAGVMLGLASAIQNTAILLFAALPVVWGSIAVVQSITIMIYGWIARVYDKDFLSTQTVYGDDYGKEVESEEEAAPKAKDEAGADFLRNN